MSSDKEQEYFSDGISEEILNVLAKIPKLNVTSHSSSFYYKGKDIKLNKVAEELGIEIATLGVATQKVNIDVAMQHLRKAVDKGYIIFNAIRTEPIYERLRQHPEWSEILAESNKRVVLQLEIYFKMVAEDKKANL